MASQIVRIRVRRRRKVMCYVKQTNFREAVMNGWTVWLDPPIYLELPKDSMTRSAREGG